MSYVFKQRLAETCELNVTVKYSNPVPKTLFKYSLLKPYDHVLL